MASHKSKVSPANEIVLRLGHITDRPTRAWHTVRVFDQAQKERSRHGSTIIRTGTDVVYGGYCFLNMSHSGSQGFKGKIPAGYALLRRQPRLPLSAPTLPQASTGLIYPAPRRTPQEWQPYSRLRRPGPSAFLSSRSGEYSNVGPFSATLLSRLPPAANRQFPVHG